MKSKLAIFDLDGTLFNTSIVNFMAYERALELNGFALDLNFPLFKNISSGVGYNFFLPKLIPGISEKEIRKVHQAKQDCYSKYLHNAIKNEHLFSIISSIRSAYSIAIVTSASFRNVQDILKYFEVENSFDFIITQEDVRIQKPSPEGFLKAIKIAKVSINDVLIFEDSDVGIQAAKSTGAKFIKVYGYN